MKLKKLSMAAGISGAVLGIGMLAIATPVSANHEPFDIPEQGDPRVDTPIMGTGRRQRAD